MKINSHLKSLFLDKETQASKIAEVKTQEELLQHNEKDQAVIIKTSPVICFCGTYDHMGKLDPNNGKWSIPEPKEKPIRIKQYLEDNPVVKKILHKYNDWLKDDVTKIPNNTDDFKKFLEKHPGAKKKAEEHMGFFKKYLKGWRSFQKNPSTQLNPEGVPHRIEPSFNPLEIGAPPKPKNLNGFEFTSPGELEPNGESIKVRVPKFKLHNYIQENPEVKEVLNDYSNWSKDNNVPLREEEAFNKYLANNEKAEKYVKEHSDFFNRLFKRFENVSFNLFKDFIA